MKKITHIAIGFVLSFVCALTGYTQIGTSPAPYCLGNYSSGNCNQGGPSNTPGNGVNDFINTFITSGGTDNIVNANSGCNNGPSNYANYCQHYLSVAPGQVITCTVQSGITYAQGFAIFIDWNQDNVFNLPSELVAATPGVPPAASFNTLTFTVPATQPNGAYRLRVRCVFATAGTGITPCGNYTFGETEDYTLYVGPVPPSSGVVTATATSNSPLCSGQTLSLNVASANSFPVTYTWTGPGSYLSTTQNPVITNVTSAASGIYTVITSGTCPTQKTVAVVVAPNAAFTITPANPVICPGNIFTAAAVFLNPVNASQFSYVWSCNVPPGTFVPGGIGAGIFAPNSQNTTIAPDPIIAPQAILYYTVVVTPTVLSCPVTQIMTLTINNPVTPTLNIPPTICNTASPINLTGNPSGGTWNGNPGVSPNGVFTPAAPVAIGTNTLVYSVTVGTCIVSTSGTISVSKFNTPALTANISTLCVLDPLFDLMTIVQSTVNGSWSAPGAYVSANKFNPSGLATGNYPLTYSTTSSPIASVCPASTVLIVPVFSPPTPVITPITPVCNNAGTVQLTATPTIGGVWANSAVAALTGVLTPSSVTNFNSANTVSYTSGNGTCTAVKTATFLVYQFRTAAFSGTVPNLCVSSNPFNLLSIAQNTSGAWNGINTSLNTFNPAGLQTGNYTLTYANTPFNAVTPNPTLCPETRTIAVSVFNPPTPNITQVGPYCSTRGPIQLTVTPNTGAWVASSYVTTNGLFTPSLSPVGNNVVTYVIGSSTCNAQQTKSISVEAFVPAAITTTIADQCNNGAALNLQPYTSNNLGTWSGPGVLGTNFDPAVAGTGNVTLYYNTASSPSGLCPDQATIAVNIYSLAVPFFNSTGPYCSSNPPVQLGVSPVGGIFGGFNTNAIASSGLFNPAMAPIGDNIINYSITAGPCVAYAQATIVIEKFVSANFNDVLGVVCRNDDRLRLNMNTFALTSGGIWSGPGITDNHLFTFANANPGINHLTYYTHSATQTLCPDYKTMDVEIIEIPNVKAVSSSYSGCAPILLSLTTPSTASGEGTWNFGDGSENERGLNINHLFTTPGTYNVVFTYSIAAGIKYSCSAFAGLDNPIRIYETPKADFSFAPDEIMISEPLVKFNNTSSVLSNNRYNWHVSGPGFENTYDELHPTVQFPRIGEYKISLNAISLHGCKSDIVKTVNVKSEFSIYIPNTFTPNEDNINDVFRPVFSDYGFSEKNYEMQIFDRWGTLLFSTRDRAVGWDGSIQNKGQQFLKQEVYVYKIKYKDIEGNVYSKMGQVTLIK